MKTFSIILILMLSVIFLDAQTINCQFGMTISHLKFHHPSGPPNDLHQGKVLTETVSIGIEYLKKKHFHLSSNIGYIYRLGSQLVTNFDIEGNEINKANHLAGSDYMSINTLIEFKHKIGKHIIPFLSVGPRFDILLSNTNDLDAIKEFGEFNNLYGMITGGGIKYDMSRFSLGLRADYYIDFNNVADWKLSATSETSTLRAPTYAINLVVGVNL